MAGYQQAQWLISGSDFRVHAFKHVSEPAGFLEALCQHTVPPDRIVRPEETTLVPPKCDRCLLQYGQDLASQSQWRMD